MPLDTGLEGEDIAPVLSTDVLNVGRLKYNSSIEAIRVLLNYVEHKLQAISAEDVVGLLVAGSINPDYLQNLVLEVNAQDVNFSSPNFGATTVAGALEEIFSEGGGTAASVSVADNDNYFIGTNVEEILAELYETVDAIVTSEGNGDVLGPSSSTNNNLAVFDGSSGKFIKDGGVSVSSFAAASHQHNASDVTTGILSVARGGTGLGNYTTGNYLRASGSSTLEQRSPAQVRADIGAMAVSGGTFTGTVAFDSGAVIGNSWTIQNNVPLYLKNNANEDLSVFTANSANQLRLGNVGFASTLYSSSPINVNISGTTTTLLHTGSVLNSLSDVNVSGASNGEVLTFNGSDWIASPPTGGGGGGEGYLPLTGGTLTGNLSLDSRLFYPLGAQASPSLSITGDTDTGIYSPGANQLGLSTGGANRVHISNTGLRLAVSGSAATPSISSTGDTDTGLYFSAANTMSVATGGAARVHFSDTGISLQSAGTAGAPVIALQSDMNTGIYFSGADALSFATGGVQRVTVSNSGLSVGANAVLTTGSVLGALANVNASSPSTGNVLTWTGAAWEPSDVPGGGGGGDVSNPMVANLNAAGFQITNARIVGNQDVSYNLATDALNMVTGGVATLSAAYNAYHFSDLTSNLQIKLPPVSSGLPYGFISINLDANVTVSIADDPKFVWSKVSLDDANPVIPSTSGSSFTIFYRFDPVISGYTGTMTVMQSVADFTVTSTITEINYDGQIQPVGELFNRDSIANTLGFFTGSGERRHNWFWLESVNVPKNAVITNAVITVRPYSNRTGPFVHRVYMNNVDNASMPTTFANVNDATLTTAYNEINLPSVASASTYDLEFTAALQELVNRSGWVSGNSAVIQIRDFSNSPNYWQTRAGSSETINLSINYQA